MAQAKGYYYDTEGLLHGRVGQEKKVLRCSGTKKTKKIVDKKEVYDVTYLETVSLDISFDDFMEIAAVAYAESSIPNGVKILEEVYGLASAIKNYKDKVYKGSGGYKDSIKHMQAFAQEGTRYKEFMKAVENDKTNGTKYQLCIAAVMNAIYLENKIDYSGGATHWDGNDIKKAKWKQGMEFNQGSDIWGIKDNKKPGKILYGDKSSYEKIYDYMWTALKGYIGENPNFKNPHFPYYEKDTINEHRSGTVFVKVSTEFSTQIKYGTKKAEKPNK